MDFPTIPSSFSPLSDYTSLMLCHTGRHVAAFVFLSVNDKKKRRVIGLCIIYVKCQTHTLLSEILLEPTSVVLNSFPTPDDVAGDWVGEGR